MACKRLETENQILEYFAGAGKSPRFKEKPHDFAWRMVKERVAYAHMEPHILYYVLNHCALTRSDRQKLREAINFYEQFGYEEIKAEVK